MLIPQIQARLLRRAIVPFFSYSAKKQKCNSEVSCRENKQKSKLHAPIPEGTLGKQTGLGMRTSSAVVEARRSSKHATLHDGTPTRPNESGVARRRLGLRPQSQPQLLSFARALAQAVSGLEASAVVARVHVASPLLVGPAALLVHPGDAELAAHGRMAMVLQIVHAVLERRAGG